MQSASKEKNLIKEILTYIIALEPVIAIALAYLVPWNSRYSIIIQKISVGSIFWLWPVLLIGYAVVLREKSKNIDPIVDEKVQIIDESPQFSIINRENILIFYWLIQFIFPKYTSRISIFEVPIQWFIMFFTYIYGFQTLGNTIYYFKLKKQEYTSAIDANFKYYMMYSFFLIMLPLLTILRVYFTNFDYPLLFIFILGPCMFFFMMGWSMFDVFYDKDTRVLPRFASVSYLMLMIIILLDFMRTGFVSEFLYGASLWSKLFILNAIVIILFNFFTQNRDVFRVYLVWSLSYFNIFIYNLVFFTNDIYKNSSILGINTILMIAIMIPNTLNLAEHDTRRLD